MDTEVSSSHLRKGSCTEESSLSQDQIKPSKNIPTTLPWHFNQSLPVQYPTQDVFKGPLIQGVSLLGNVEGCGRLKQTKHWKILQLLNEVHIVILYTSVVFQLSFVLCKVGKITQNKVRKATFPASMKEVQQLLKVQQSIQKSEQCSFIQHQSPLRTIFLFLYMNKEFLAQHLA